MPPAARCVGQRALPARGRRLLDHELEDRIVVAVVLDELCRIRQIGEGEAWALFLALDEESGLALAQGIQRDPVREVSLPIDRRSRGRNQRSSEVIRGNQRSSKVIRGRSPAN